MRRITTNENKKIKFQENASSLEQFRKGTALISKIRGNFIEHLIKTIVKDDAFSYPKNRMAFENQNYIWQHIFHQANIKEIQTI